jgi:membrane-associated phospholipid phosphatase
VRKSAQAISVLFHPLLMTTYLFGVLVFCIPSILAPMKSSPWIVFLVFLMTFLLPVLNFLFFRMSGTIRDLSMIERKDRVLPFALITILYCVVTYMFYLKFPVPNLIKMMLIITAMVIVSAVVTLFYKVSVHAVAVWGVVGIMLPLNKAVDGVLLYPLLAGIVIAGIVMSTRLFLDVHRPREVLVGSLIGFIIGFTGMLLLF